MNIKTVYFAGKVSKDGFRQQIFGSRVMSEGIKKYQVGNDTWVIYGGPFAISNDHGTWHGDGSHGWGTGDDHIESGGFVDDNGRYVKAEYQEHGMFYLNSKYCDKNDVVKRCLRQIEKCDAVHAYIDSNDCHGTLVELGYAAALGKPIYINWGINNLIPHPVYELWFAGGLPIAGSVYDELPTYLFEEYLVRTPKESKFQTIEDFITANRDRLKFIHFSELKQFGAKASKLCRDAGLEINKVPHFKWGTVNAYPKSVLELIFAEYLLQ
jgi:hypothetical protein